MLLIASESIRGARAISDVAREMSLAVSYFSRPEKLGELLTGRLRRIVLLDDADVTDSVIERLVAAGDAGPLGVLVAADEPTLASSDKANLVAALEGLPNVQWLGAGFGFDSLAEAARECRRAMLTVSQDDLTQAFDNGEFVVQYQPKVERDGGVDWVTREAEALIRWQHPQHGLVGPLEFLPEIEAFGMMPALTEFVLQKAAAQLQEWERQGLRLKGCINLAPSLLNDADLGARYAAIVREYELEPRRFTFEIVEQELDNPEAPHLKAIRNLRAEGFRLSLDDFRVAAASLAAFEQLPFDEIKIHASALRQARENAVAMHVLAAVAGLAHNLGMSVCAEGVEDQDAFEFLEMIECDKMQGFLISEAVLPHIIQRVYSARDSSAEVA
ncbi:MAG: EAL domain-containing protein [Woeseiaceae bacterium]|nr:EAL domain-containing protein [Woeseiaceae bacterium]